MTDTSRIADLDSSPIAYDDNITLVGYAGEPRSILSKDQYFVLMVTDIFNIDARPDQDYWMKQYGWVGLECTSGPNGVYISKDFSTRHNGYRGITLIATVKDASLCRELGK